MHAEPTHSDYPETTTIEKRHRQYLIPLLIPILCGKLLAGKGKSKETTDTRRSAVLSYAGGMTDSELLLLLDFLLQPFQRALQQCGDPCGSAMAGKFEVAPLAASDTRLDKCKTKPLSFNRK